MARWPQALREWARKREAEVDAVGLSPQRAALLEARVPFHLAFRAACRLSIALSGDGRTALRRTAVVASAAWDVAEAVRLRRDPRLRVSRRLASDLADVAAWSAVSERAYPVVPTVGVPLVTETALRYQWAAAPLLLAHLAVAAGARKLAHKPLQPTNLGHLALALLFGMGLRRVERAGAERVRGSFDAEIRAAETTALIAGQYQVARNSYVVDGERLNPHDVLSGIRLHFPAARDRSTALHDFTWGGRKRALETLASEKAVQLDTALRAWKRDTNCRRSAVADQVLDPALPEGDGMTLLSGDQVGRLAEALDTLDLRGAAAVRVVEATRPGARVVLEVNGARVVLAPDPPRTTVLRADPAPVAILEGGILWALLEATEAADAAPLWSVLPGIAAFSGLAAWARRALCERGEAAHEAIVSLSAGAALVQAAAVHAAIRGAPDRVDGSQRFPMQTALNAPTVLAGFCWPSLSTAAKWRTAAGFGALLALGVALLERPRWRADLVRNGVWLPALFATSLAYAEAGSREAERARAEVQRLQAEAADAAVQRGERREWERIRTACAEALEWVDCVGPSARAAVEQRLQDLYRLAEERLGGNERD